MTTCLPFSRSLRLDIIGEGGIPRQANARQLHHLPGRDHEAEDWEYPTSRSAATGPSRHLLIAIGPHGRRDDRSDLPSV